MGQVYGFSGLPFDKHQSINTEAAMRLDPSKRIRGIKKPEIT